MNGGNHERSAYALPARLPEMSPDRRQQRGTGRDQYAALPPLGPGVPRTVKTAKIDSHSVSHSPAVVLSYEHSKQISQLVGVAGFEPAASSSRRQRLGA